MKLLPFPDEPVFLCYHNKAFPFGIIQANANGDFMKWLCSKGVGCIFNPCTSPDKFDLDIIDQWGNMEGATERQTFKLKNDMIGKIGIDFLSMLRTVIDNDCYIRGIFNEKYIPHKDAYNRYDYIHDFLIIGYDDDYFYSAGYIENGRFRRFEIPVQNFLQSLYDSERDMVQVEFISINRDFVLKPNIPWMISELEKYLSNTDPEGNDRPSYGLSAIVKLRDFFINEVKEKNRIYIDRRYSRVLLEHEWMLTQVPELFLSDSEKTDYIIQANANYEKARLIHMMGLKMSFTGESDLIEPVVKKMNEIMESEMDYIPYLIETLKKKYGK